MALKQCKECGKQISTQATSCPNCGAVLKKKTGVFTWIVAIFFILVMIGMCQDSNRTYVENPNKSHLKNLVDNYFAGDSTTGVNPSMQDKINYEVVSLATLLEQYKDNEVRADEFYKNKFIQITGKVGTIKKDIINNIYVTLGTGRDFEMPMAQCFFDDKLAYQVSQLSKDDTITVQGRVNGLMMNVLIKECTLVQPDKNKTTVNDQEPDIHEITDGFKIMSYSKEITVIASGVCSKLTESKDYIKKAKPVKTCYKHEWKEWVNNIYQITAGELKSEIERDSNVASPATDILVYPDNTKRIVFNGCRPHECNTTDVFFLLDTTNKNMDIVWNVNGKKKYLGPNAELLRQNNLYDYLSKYDSDRHGISIK